MATKASTKAAVKSSRAKNITVKFQKPGSVPEVLKVKAGTTVADLVQELNLDGYVISLNGSTVGCSSTKELQKDDTVRVGVKTKNA